MKIQTKQQSKQMNTSNTGRQNLVKPITVKAVARIYAATARQNNGMIPAGGAAVRAARAAAQNALHAQQPALKRN